MAISVQSILDKVNHILNDESNVTYTLNEKLGWLNNAQLEIARVPGNNSLTTVIQLAAGAKQAKPADAIAMIDFIRNMGSNGATPGDIIRIIPRGAMDSIPDWMSGGAADVVEHVVYEPEKNDGIYYVYPPNTGTMQIEVTYAKYPATVTSIGNISIDDEFETAIIDYIAYRAYSKDTDAAAAERANFHFEKFVNATRSA